MVDQNIVNYIKQQLNAGYDINSIRSALVNYGYDAGAVEEAIKASQPSKGIPVIPIAAGVVAVLLVISLFFIFRGGEEERLLDLEISSVMHEVEAGDSIQFNVELINMGTGKRYDVSLTHQIIDSSNRIITTKQEALAVETRTSSSSQIAVPYITDKGRYTLKTTAFYDTKTAVSSLMFDVKAKEVSEEPAEVVEDKCPATCDDYNACTQDICNAATGYKCSYLPITPCCGNDICESGESSANCPADCAEEAAEEPTTATITLKDVIEKAKQDAQIDPSLAAAHCGELAKKNYQDSCYNTIAEESSNSIYCERIASETSRDNCYTNFALAGDYSVCDKLTNKYLKASCIALSESA